MPETPLEISDLTSTSEIEIRLVRTATVLDMIALYKDAGWWEDAYDRDHGFLKKIPEGSALFAGAFMGKKMIGMGRVLSDRSSDAYIQDIVVLKPYQGRGLGKKIVQKLIRGLKEMGVDWIGLIAEPGTNPFYENLGFREMKGYVPFKLEESNDK